MWFPISFFGKPRGSRPTRRRPGCKLLVERLEDRTLLSYDFGYALGLGSDKTDRGMAVAADTAGNAVVAGFYKSASIDLDPGPGSYVLPNAGGNDGFVAKYDPLGNLLWGVHFASPANTAATDVAIDGASNVLVTGNFQGSMEIGAPGQTPVTLTNAGINESFLAKIDATGNVLWATTFGATADPRFAYGVAVDPAGNVYATGSEANKLFVAKYSAGGATVWTKVVSEGTGITNGAGVTSYAYGADVAVDAGGNVHVTRSYLGKMDFNTDPKKTNSLTSVGWQQISSSWNDAFVLKLNASGAYVWAGSMGGRGADGGLGIALDAAGNVHVNGYNGGDPEGDFDPGRGKLNLPCSGSCGFVVKLDPNRNLLWGKSGVGRFGIAVDGAGAVYTTEGGIFVSQLNSAGSLVWTGGPGVGVGSEGIAVDGQGNIFITGSFSGTVDFDPGAGTYSLTSTLDSIGNPTVDAFVSKLVPSSALQAAGGTVPNATGEANLSAEQITPLLAEALARWQAAGVDSSGLEGVNFQIADLPGAALGEAAGNTIWLDADAAGWGWFVDPTPADDAEFTLPGNQGEQRRMDLLTVLAHELGHVLGYEHEEAGVMAEALAAGTRLMPASADAALTSVVAEGDLLAAETAVAIERTFTMSGRGFINANSSSGFISGRFDEVPHLGRTIFLADVNVDLLQNGILEISNLRFRAARSAFLFATPEVTSYDPDNGIASGTLTFTGGTGRFEDVSGTADFVFDIDLDSVNFDYTIDGTIRY